MTANAYTEDQLVEQPAIELFAELGWQTASAVKAQLERMVRLNRTRADYLEKFEALIEAYNSGSRNIEEIFKDLVALAYFAACASAAAAFWSARMRSRSPRSP